MSAPLTLSNHIAANTMDVGETYIWTIRATGSNGLSVSRTTGLSVGSPAEPTAVPTTIPKYPVIHRMAWRPFLSGGNWILPEVDQAAGLTGLECQLAGTSGWQACSYSTQSDPNGVLGKVDWVVPAVGNEILEFRAISQVNVNGVIVTKAIWNFPPSSG